MLDRVGVQVCSERESNGGGEEKVRATSYCEHVQPTTQMCTPSRIHTHTHTHHARYHAHILNAPQTRQRQLKGPCARRTRSADTQRGHRPTCQDGERRVEIRRRSGRCSRCIGAPCHRLDLGGLCARTETRDRQRQREDRKCVRVCTCARACAYVSTKEPESAWWQVFGAQCWSKKETKTVRKGGKQ